MATTKRAGPPPLPPDARRSSKHAAATLARPPTPSPYVANLPPMRAPMPSEEGFMSTPDKLSLAEFAYALRDEQVQAKVAHYRADLETNPELDAITAQVVAELQALQKKAARESTAPPSTTDKKQLEIELIEALKQQLSRLFRTGKLASVFERKLAEVSKRFARLFFESELHEKIRGSEQELKTLRFAEQALFRVLTRFEQHHLLELESFEYESPDILERAKELYAGLVRELRTRYLGRTTPELNALVSYLNEVLTTFLVSELPPLVGELAWRVVKESKIAYARLSASYKVPADGFATFRSAFERHFLQLLVPYVEDEMLRHVRAKQGKFRSETIRFVADPHIFVDVCELICDATYDFLYNEGFLDLPTDWRARLAADEN